MSAIEEIMDKFKSFYKDIDFEIDQLKSSHNSVVRKTNDSSENDNKLKDILNTVKSIDENARKVTEKKARKFKYTKRTKSSFPPIWNDNKLNNYIQNVLNDIMNSPDEESKETILEIEENNDKSLERTTISHSFMNNESRIPETRNVGTNIRFLIHDKGENNLKEKRNLCAERVNRKTQTGDPNDLKIGVNRTNEKSFPQRVERVVNNDESVSVNFKKHFRVSSNPKQLAFSATTFTSTNGLKKSTLTRSDNVMHVIDSNLVTNDTKQMSSVLLPVLSIKGKCSVHNIYHFEISPTTVESLQCNDNDNGAANVKFIELKYDSKSRDIKNEIVADDISKDVTSSPDLSEKRNLLVNVNDIRNALRHYNVNIDDGKIHVVLDDAKSKEMQMRRNRRRKKQKIMGHKGSQRNVQVAKENLVSEIKKNEEIQNEVDSSSTLTDDDRKLCDILKIYGEMNGVKERGNKRINIYCRRENRYSTYPYPTNTSSNETHNVTNEVKKSNDQEYNVITESFQSIYKLIEDTFQSNLVETEVCENEKESENGMGEMNQVIKMSEDNIKKAEMLLQKYRISKKDTHDFTSNKDEQSMTEKPKILDTNHKVNFDIDRRENNVNNSCYVEKASVQQNDININEGSTIQCQNYAVFTEELQNKMQRNVENSAVQTTNDKSLQTDENFDWKSRYYFKSIYDNYSNIDFDKTKVSKDMSKLHHSVSFNPIYSNDDEIMNVANKFLRSIEKEKKRRNTKNSDEEDDEESSNYQLQSLKESSSSISTPLSDLILHDTYQNEFFTSKNTQNPSNFRNELDYTYSDGEILSLGEVKFPSSLSDESSLDEN